MKLSDFDFYLPEKLIAQHPADKRDESKLLILHKSTGEIEHKHFYDIIDYLNRDDDSPDGAVHYFKLHRKK